MLVRRALLAAVSIACFLGALVAVPLAIRAAMNAAGTEYGMTTLGSVARLDMGLRRFPTPEDRVGVHVALLGDSTAIAYPSPRSIPFRLQAELSRGNRGNVEVHPVAFSGMNPFDYLYLSSPIASVAPERVVMGLNLAAFSAPSRG